MRATKGNDEFGINSCPAFFRSTRKKPPSLIPWWTLANAVGRVSPVCVASPWFATIFSTTVAGAGGTAPVGSRGTNESRRRRLSPAVAPSSSDRPTRWLSASSTEWDSLVWEGVTIASTSTCAQQFTNQTLNLILTRIPTLTLLQY